MATTMSLIAMGGTISTERRQGASEPAKGAAELARQAGLPDGTQVRVVDSARVSSRNVTPRHMWELAAAVRREIDAGSTGIVVTHGTDTLEETAYGLALLVPRSVPVVLTGAMRTPESPGADGPANIAAAFAVAARPTMAAYGPVVVHQDEIHAARWVTKVYSTRVAAFASPTCGPLGLVVEGAPVLFHGPPPGEEVLSAAAPPDADIALLWMYSGLDAATARRIIGNAEGLVIAGTGGGHVPADVAPVVEEFAASGRPVVLGSRCAAGQVLSGTYGGPGSETKLLASGVLSAGTLPALKARLRLLFGVSAGIPAASLFPTATEQADE